MHVGPATSRISPQLSSARKLEVQDPAQQSQDDETEALVDFAGFWRRLASFVVDILLLAGAGAGLGFLMPNVLAGLGQWWCHFFGFSIVGLYYFVCDSEVVDGQSLGRYLLGIRVQSLEGALIDQGQAGLRFLAFGVPVFGIGLHIDVGAAPIWVQFVPGTVMLALILLATVGNTYLLIFNRPSRRLIHDLVTGTVVVRRSGADKPVSAPLAEWHWAVLAAIPGMGILALVSLVSAWPVLDVDVAALARAQSRVEAVPGVVQATLAELNVKEDGRSSNQLFISVDENEWPSFTKDTAAQFVWLVATEYPGINAVDSVQVQIRRGFDLGIFKSWHRQLFVESPAAWRAGAQEARSNGHLLPRPVLEAPADLFQKRDDASGQPGATSFRHYPEVQAQVDASLAAAAPVRDAMGRFLIAHHRPPDESELRAAPAFQPVSAAGFNISAGAGGSVDIILKGGALDGHSWSWVPLGKNGLVNWVCAQGSVPAEYFLRDCK